MTLDTFVLILFGSFSICISFVGVLLLIYLVHIFSNISKHFIDHKKSIIQHGKHTILLNIKQPSCQREKDESENRGIWRKMWHNFK